MATVARAVLDKGKIIFQKMRTEEAPSSLAASSRSLGMVKKNWRSRKMKKAPQRRRERREKNERVKRPSCCVSVIKILADEAAGATEANFRPLLRKECQS